MKKSHFVGAAALVGVVVAVRSCDMQPREQPDLSQAQKDSIVSELPVPGASGVGDAMRARDRANARAAAQDSAGGRR